ncbi:MAG: hypothetical protein WC969_09335 [Elusimicrobiota bacterium]|jgi:hypothetical protein
MKSTFVLALLAALCGTASAQSLTDGAFAAQLQGIRVQALRGGKTVAAGIQAADRKAAPKRLLDSVLVSMNDQPGTAASLVEWLRDNNAVVEFNDLVQDGSAHAWLGDSAADRKVPAVYVSPLAMEPVSHRYLGILIARETAELMLKDFPESAEKRYMVASRAAETFFELGGTRMDMEDIDGHRDEKVAATLRLWVENDPSGGVQVLKSRGVQTLKDLEAGLASESNRLVQLIGAIDGMLVVPNDPNAPSLQAELDATRAELGRVSSKQAAVKAAKAQFETFSQDEKAYLWEHQGSLQ